MRIDEYSLVKWKDTRKERMNSVELKMNLSENYDDNS